MPASPEGGGGPNHAVVPFTARAWWSRQGKGWHGKGREGGTANKQSSPLSSPQAATKGGTCGYADAQLCKA